MNKLSGWNDTIVALATPQGIGSIAVIRLSGSESWSIVDQLFPSKQLKLQSSHTLHVGYLRVPKDFPSAEWAGRTIDEVVISLYKGPRSYTGEDVVEISTHGSPYIAEQVLNICLQLGARMAKPGEFTQRAFLSGKMDLTQAEAVADLIASETAAAHQTALHGIRGGFSLELKALREELLKFSALLELELDFSQEDVEFADRAQFYDLLNRAKTVTRNLIDSFRLGNVIKNGVQVAIIGAPNAGKSTLLNALLNENRAIVSDIAGTTRDTIEETLNIDGILFRLIDTAGIREHTADLVESIGVEKSLEKMKQADLVLYLFDVRDELSSLDASLQPILETGTPYLLLGNKSDLMSSSALEEKFSGWKRVVNGNGQVHPPILFLSAKAGTALQELKDRLVSAVVTGDLQTEQTVVTNARHYQALQQVASAIDDTLQAMDRGLPGDLIALDVRRCLHFIGEITGEINTEDKLDYIFSKFCIGK